MRSILAVILLAFLVTLGIFAVQNTQAVAVRFLNWTLNAPFALLAIVIYLAGMLSGGTVVAFLRRSIARVTSPPTSR
jgi:lipopolysaccharide assembly protein A